MKKSLFLFLILIFLPLLVFAEKTHQVKPGESLEKIAKKHGVTAVSYTHLTLPTTPYV